MKRRTFLASLAALIAAPFVTSKAEGETVLFSFLGASSPEEIERHNQRHPGKPCCGMRVYCYKIDPKLKAAIMVEHDIDKKKAMVAAMRKTHKEITHP